MTQQETDGCRCFFHPDDYTCYLSWPQEECLRYGLGSRFYGSISLGKSKSRQTLIWYCVPKIPEIPKPAACSVQKNETFSVKCQENTPLRALIAKSTKDSGRDAQMRQAMEPHTAWIESWLGDIYAYFRRLGVDVATAEDLTQETFIIAWQNYARLRAPEKLRSWLYGIAYRCNGMPGRRQKHILLRKTCKAR